MPQGLVESQAPVITIVGKTWDLHVTEVLAPLDENLRMIADSVAYCTAHVRGSDLRRRAFLRRLQAQPRLRAEDAEGRAEDGGATVLVLCDTNGGTLPEDVAEIDRAGQRKLPGAGRHPLPQRLRRGRGQLAGRRRCRARCRCRAPSTASANAAATRTSRSIIANLQLKMGFEAGQRRQREPARPELSRSSTKSPT